MIDWFWFLSLSFSICKKSILGSRFGFLKSGIDQFLIECISFSIYKKLVLDFKYKFLRSGIDWFSFIYKIPLIIQDFTVVIIAKSLLKELPIFFRASNYLAKYLIKGLKVVFLYYVLL